MRITSLILTAGLLTGCTIKEETVTEYSGAPSIQSLAWLEGKWVQQDTASVFIEEWRIAGDHLAGQGRIVKGTDTVDMERLRIVGDSTGITYIVNLPDREVQFRSTQQTESTKFDHLKYSAMKAATFVSDTNDFPRQIVYRRQDDDSLYITLTGSEAGKPMEMTFKMKKQ